jgi:hypothetical protein
LIHKGLIGEQPLGLFPGSIKNQSSDVKVKNALSHKILYFLYLRITICWVKNKFFLEMESGQPNSLTLTLPREGGGDFQGTLLFPLPWREGAQKEIPCTI